MVNFYIPLSKLCLQARPSITSSQKGSNLMSVLKQSSIPNYSGPSAEGEWFADSIVYEPFLVFNGAVMVDYRRISHLSYQAYQELNASEASLYNGLYNSLFFLQILFVHLLFLMFVQ